VQTPPRAFRSLRRPSLGSSPYLTFSVRLKALVVAANSAVAAVLAWKRYVPLAASLSVAVYLVVSCASSLTAAQEPKPDPTLTPAGRIRWCHVAPPSLGARKMPLRGPRRSR
jgi:hypothetical protein